MPQIKAVLFDIGGVLIDDVTHSERMGIANAFSVTIEQATDAVRKNSEGLSRGILSEPEFWKRMATTLCKPVPSNPNTLWYEIMKKGMKVKDETKAIAERLRKAGCITGILSNTEVSHVRYMKEANLFHGYSPLILSCEVGFIKPEKEIFQIALDRLGLPANQVAFTDNTKAYTDIANNLGISAYHFGNTAGLESWLSGLGLDF